MINSVGNINYYKFNVRYANIRKCYLNLQQQQSWFDQCEQPFANKSLIYFCTHIENLNTLSIFNLQANANILNAPCISPLSRRPPPYLFSLVRRGREKFGWLSQRQTTISFPCVLKYCIILSYIISISLSTKLFIPTSAILHTRNYAWWWWRQQINPDKYIRIFFSLVLSIIQRRRFFFANCKTFSQLLLMANDMC